MLSRWTDFLHSDGEKEWRDRDLEFEQVIKTRIQLIEKWNDGWNCLEDGLSYVNGASGGDMTYFAHGMMLCIFIVACLMGNTIFYQQRGSD